VSVEVCAVRVILVTIIFLRRHLWDNGMFCGVYFSTAELIAACIDADVFYRSTTSLLSLCFYLFTTDRYSMDLSHCESVTYVSC